MSKSVFLDGKENEVFYNVLSAELKCLMDEYDSDTGRKPGRKRMARLPVLEGVVSRWEDFQLKTVGPSGTDVVVLSGPPVSCVIPLSDREAAVCRDILKESGAAIVRYLGKFDPPYAGILLDMSRIASTAEGLCRKLA